MKLFKYLMFLLCLMFLVTQTHAQKTQKNINARDVAPLILSKKPNKRPPPTEIGLQVEMFFIKLQQEKVDDAFKILLEKSAHIKKKYDINEFINKTKQAFKLYGKMNGYELYDNRSVGSRLVYLTYFIYLESVPLRWRLIYYSPNNRDWKLINLSVDDLLDESLLAE